MKINPPIKLNFKVKPSNMNDIPKYIGFLEYLKIPVTTREEAFSIDIGLMVVSWFLNEIIAVTRTDIPTIKEILDPQSSMHLSVLHNLVVLSHTLS